MMRRIFRTRVAAFTSAAVVCLGKPAPDEMIVSGFDLDSAFKNYFSKKETPGITGIGFGIDTSKAVGGGFRRHFCQEYRVLAAASVATHLET
jgi:hypothetical protein